MFYYQLFLFWRNYVRNDKYIKISVTKGITLTLNVNLKIQNMWQSLKENSILVPEFS